jgi:tetratricopeptide (TPR) repeat protein
MGSKNRRSKRYSSQTRRSFKRSKTRTPADKTTFFGLFKKDKKQKDVKTASRTQVTGWKLWLFRILAITVIPALLFLLLEVGLRLAGYGYPTSMTIPCKVNDTDYYCSNIRFSWRFFNPDIARAMDPFVFPAKKSEQTYRIFVMGASAAAGTPDGAFSFGRLLHVFLSRRYPQTNFEVITAAMPAINSHVVLEIAKDCVRHQPDLFIVYLGNNEVVGPYGAGTVFAPLSSNLSLIRFGIAFKSTKLGQLLTSLLGWQSAGNSPKIWRGLQMFLDKQVRADDPQMEIVYRHFQENLQDICRLANQNNTKIIVCTVGSNLKDSPPFASAHRLNLTDTGKEQWDQLYQQGVAFETNGNFSSAADQYLKAAEIDGSYADLQFRLGHCYWEMGEYDKSKDRFVQAREMDTLRFRADNRINTIIRDIAGEKTAEQIYLVDANKLFKDNSPHGIPGQELFYEHVHLNFRGNYLLARTIFQQVQKILPERIKQNVLTTSQIEDTQESLYPSEQEIARYLAYNDWDRYRIAEKVIDEFLKQPPFTNQLYHSERLKRMEQQLKVLKAALTPKDMNEVEQQYRWAIQQTPSDAWLYWKYGLMLESEEKFTDAAEQYKIVLKNVPNHYEAYAKLGFYYGTQGDLNAAIEYNLKAVSIYPSFAEAYFNLGLAYHLKGMYSKAVESYSNSIRLIPDQSQSYNNLALVLYKQGKVAEALQTYRDGLKFMPDDLNLHYNLAVCLKDQGQKDEAIKELREALKIDPNSAKAHKVLNSLLNQNSG